MSVFQIKKGCHIRCFTVESCFRESLYDKGIVTYKRLIRMSTLDMKQSRVYQFGKRLLEFVLLWVFCGGFFGTKPELTKSLWVGLDTGLSVRRFRY